jgi:GMP synthase (glutamine-hydrolysing) A subunit
VRRGSDEMKTVLVIDFGGQYSQLIARRVRECRVYSELVPYDTPAGEIAAAKPGGIILSGGPRSVNDPDAPAIDPALLELGVPVLGICYGLQLLAKLRGGRVEKTGVAEYGGRTVSLSGKSELLAGLPKESACWMSHGDSVLELPSGFNVTAVSPNFPVAAMEDCEAKLYGVQFHPEVQHTEHGHDILKNFLYNICDLAPTWTPASIIEEAVARVREQVGSQHVVCGLSGGVDSAVAALLVYKAVGDQLTCIFVDHGLMREKEAEQVEDTFRKHFHVPLVHVRAQERFLTRLAGVTDPEQKRKIILRRRVAQAGQGQVPCTRHHISGCHRVGHQVRGPHQVTSQRGRPAGRCGLRPGRASTHAVQGRSPGGRRRTGLARGYGLAAALPGSRTSHTHHRRRHAGEVGCPAKGRFHPAGRGEEGWTLPGTLADVRRPARDKERGSHG